jgi:hypothetical protein
MKKQNFYGEFSGKYDLTKVNTGGISNSSGSVTIKIEKIGKGAYLQTIVYDGINTVNILGFIKDETIISQNQSGNGISYTYFDGKYLIHKDSNKPSSPNWSVKVSKLRRKKH